MPAGGKNGAMSPMNNTSSSGLEARLSARLESVLEDIGQAYNTVEDRVHVLESTSPSYIRRLGKLEEAIRPYEKYEKKTQDAINQLSGLKKKLESLKNDNFTSLEKKFQTFADGITKTTDSLTKKVDEIRPTDLTKIGTSIQELSDESSKRTDVLAKELKDVAAELTEKTDVMTKRLDEMPAVDHNQANINASVQTLLARVLKLESQVSPPREEERALSTTDLAQALITRLGQGEDIDNATLLRLREVIPASTPDVIAQESAPQPASATYQTPDSVDSHLDKAPTETSGPTKRKRSPERSNVVETPRQDESRPQKRARGSVQRSKSDARKSMRSGTDVVPEDEEPEAVESQDVRRSARTPKPNKKHESYLTWIEVRDRRKTR